MQHQLHEQVWTRFVRMPYGHVLDYARSDGSTVIPSAEDCLNSNPNPLGWWTPIENGAFFTGLYVTALLKQYDRKPDKKLADEIRILIGGLKLLQDIAQRDGFIARGVADDGSSHYPLSSEDQVAPWLMAMFQWMNSPLCGEKEEIRVRLLRQLYALRSNSWKIPCDTHENSYYCFWLKSASWRGVTKLLYCARMIYELTGDPAELANYRALRDECPTDSVFTRGEIVSQGFSHSLVRTPSLKQFWIHTCAHLGLWWLSEQDAEWTDHYARGCYLNAVTVLPFISDISNYDNQANGFDVDWHPLSHFGKPFDGDVPAAVRDALTMAKFWNANIVPHRHMEHTVLGDALFGAWIALVNPSEPLRERVAEQLQQMLQHVDWTTLTTSYAFAAEACLIYMQED